MSSGNTGMFDHSHPLCGNLEAAEAHQPVKKERVLIQGQGQSEEGKGGEVESARVPEPASRKVQTMLKA
jgi:hypothetical protein